MSCVVSTMRLKPTAKNSVGGIISLNSRTTKARTRGMSMVGFLRGRRSCAEQALHRLTPSAFGPGRADARCGLGPDRRAPPRARQGLGRRFAEQISVVACEVTEMPKAMVQSGRLHERRLRSGRFQGLAHHYQALALQIHAWAHAAGRDERPVKFAGRHTQQLTQVVNIDGP